MNHSLVCLLSAVVLVLPANATESLAEKYLQQYFTTFPSAATAAGRYDLDDRLEDLTAERRLAWVGFNRQMSEEIRQDLADPRLAFEERLDLELLLAEAERQIFEFEAIDRPGRDPLFWTGIAGNATVFLLIREDRPLAERLHLAASRVALIPRLVRQATAALAATPPADISAELGSMAERQARAAARFYEKGFPQAGAEVADELARRLQTTGLAASQALSELADFLQQLTDEAAGSPRLGEHYAEAFRLTVGGDGDVERALSEAERALQAKMTETAAYGRSIWNEVLGSELPVPEADAEVIRRLFERVSNDRARSVDEFVSDYQDLIELSIEFVRRNGIITLPEPLTLHLGRSPSYFIGQSVGGVYPAGPYAPAEAKTLLFLPMPSDDASEEEKDAFFRDFNHHFNVMIAPHELIPGHYLQSKHAATHPHKVRALFGDGVYIEGWGTFCERLMLDLGWGGTLDRMAHLKKQLENIARTIVDIKIHTGDMSRRDVLAFVQKEAFQESQFAGNMWTRSISRPTQMTTYFLGYRQVWTLYEEVRQRRGSAFELKEFMDGMMELGPVAVRHYRQLMLGESPR